MCGAKLVRTFCEVGYADDRNLRDGRTLDDAAFDVERADGGERISGPTDQKSFHCHARVLAQRARRKHLDRPIPSTPVPRMSMAVGSGTTAPVVMKMAPLLAVASPPPVSMKPMM